MDSASIPGAASIPGSGSGSGSVPASSLAVGTHPAVPTNGTTDVSAIASPDVRTAEHQAQQLASIPGSISLSMLQQSPFSPRSHQPQRHDDLAILSPTHSLNDVGSRTQHEYGISAGGGVSMAMQSPSSNAGASSIQQVAQTATFEAIPYTGPMSSPTALRDHLAGGRNQIAIGLPADYYHSRDQQLSSVQNAAHQSPVGPAARRNISFADSSFESFMQPLSGRSLVHSPINEEHPFDLSFNQHGVPRAISPHDFVDHGQNAYVSTHQRDMSQRPIAQPPLANPPLGGNLAMARGPVYSLVEREERSVPPHATSYRSIHDKGGRLLSIDQRITSQQPVSQQSVGFSFDDKTNLNRVGICSQPVRQLGSTASEDPALVHGQAAQMITSQQAMDHRYSPWQPVDDLSVTRFTPATDQDSKTFSGPQYSAVPRFGYTSLLGHAYERSFDQRAENQSLLGRRTHSGLPVYDSFDISSRQNNQPRDQQTTIVRPIGEDREASVVQGRSSWEQSYVSQQPRYYRSAAGQQIPEETIYQPVSRKPVFGFSSVAEAHAFEPWPRKRMSDFASAHSTFVEGQGRQSVVHEAADPTDRGFAYPAGREIPLAPRAFERPVPAVPFMRPSIQSHSVKQEQVSPSPFQGFKRSNDGQFDSHLASEVWNKSTLPETLTSNGVEASRHAGNQNRSNPRGFGQSVSANPSNKSEPGDILEQDLFKDNKISISGYYYHPGICGSPTWLKDLTVNYLTDSEVLYYFNVIALMGRMQPDFRYKYDSADRKNIIVNLTLWGNTIIHAELTSDSLHAAEVFAYRQTLEKMQKHNSDWVIPPLPKDGPTSPGWVWTKLLKDFCADQGFPKPRYKSSQDGMGWYCNLSINSKPYISARGCKTLTEAESTAAHMALYQLAIMGFDHSARSPIHSPFDQSSHNAPVSVWGSSGKFMESPFNSSLRPKNDPRSSVFSKYKLSTATVPKKGSLSKISPKKGPSGPSRKQPDRTVRYAGVSKSSDHSKKKASAFYYNRAKWIKRRRIEALETQLREAQNWEPVQQNPAKLPPQFAHAANRVPLSDCRLLPMEHQKDHVEDPLVRLRSLDGKLALLSPRSSFREILKTICEVLKIDYPEIFRGDRPNNSRAMFPYAHEMFAKFTGDPYLSRASPIKLCHVHNPDPEIAQEIGVKSVILYLLSIVKDDADLDQKAYETESPNVRRIECETIQSLSAQNKPIGALLY
ncbi:hypothetical protein N7457_003919 [Penicillium paradoxum]|uniref:uncharacterized protein n=1 Tax=Penicillium paradoxum TaxID=176176 RepID=UPI0025474051|nr:uncharacterized protein N7457_003919 [Penicillium paradoxum]KAJ5782145.1 hypothetical protein N7457_003919 [Penicillium paradoxum]